MELRERDGLFFSQSQNLYESWKASIRNSNSCLSKQHLKRMFFAESSLFRSKKSQWSLPLGDSCTYSLNFAATGDAGKMRYCHCLYIWVHVFVCELVCTCSNTRLCHLYFRADVRNTLLHFDPLSPPFLAVV